MMLHFSSEIKKKNYYNNGNNTFGAIPQIESAKDEKYADLTSTLCEVE